MDYSTKHENPSPRIKANRLSKLCFCWLRPFFSYGLKNNLEAKDLYNALVADHSELLGNALEKNWRKEINQAHYEHRKPKLFKAIRKTFMWSYIYYGGWLLLCTCLRIMQPHVLALLISYFVPCSIINSKQAYIYASSLIIMMIIPTFIDQHINVGQSEMGMRLRIASSSLVYRKILRLSRNSANQIAGGKVINLLLSDVARFDRVFMFLHYVWIMPIHTAAVAFLIWESVQVATLTGIVMLIIQTIPLQGYLSKITTKLYTKIVFRTDERVRLMSDIITGIQVIKMYAWEKPFQELVTCARKYEIDALIMISHLRAFNRATLVLTERTILFLTLMTYVLLGHTISADKVYSMSQYFIRLRTVMAIYVPMAVTLASEAAVTIKRLEHFLCLEENLPLKVRPLVIAKHSIKMKGVIASSNDKSSADALHDINMTIETGKLYALVGSVGCGKSSLLHLILGELRPLHGHIIVNGTVSYASQEPWLFSESVRNNILFGQPYDAQRYKEVIRTCSLLKDFDQLPQGDETLVGERGMSVSGGQRARINLARAVYRKADIYLFDDPLSSVDTFVGKRIFEECFKDYLRGKTRLLVTHQMQYLKNVDCIVTLKDGIKQNEFKAKTCEPGGVQSNFVSESSYFSDRDQHTEKEEPKETKELMGKGDVSMSLFWKYFRAGGSCGVLSTFVLLMVMGQLGGSGTDYWLTYWTNMEEVWKTEHGDHLLFLNNNSKVDKNVMNSGNTLNSTIPVYPDIYYDRDTALWIYAGLLVCGIILTIARNFLFFKICITASKTLHNRMLSCLLKVPMKFFNSNPSGRIINRFSKDINTIDDLLPQVIIDSIQIAALMIGVFAQVIIVNWWTIFPMMIMGFFYWKIRVLYLASAQDLKRLEGTTKSPVLSHVNASLAGLVTIRSARGQEMLKKEFDSHQDLHTSANSLLISTTAAFGLWLDIVTNAFVAFITYSFIIFKDGTTFAGNVGLVISQTMRLCGMLQIGIRSTTEMLTQIMSVERVVQLTQLEKEGPFESDVNSKPPVAWPNKGKIEFVRVYLRYSIDDAAVLRDLNIVIKPGMKVGIVGRTGAGKSSLIAALFNLAKFEGTVYIDSINTKRIGLHDLRSKISIIPQEPMLFSASLRDNLDPFHEYSDEQLWSALEEVELKSQCHSLDYLVNPGGSNFSVGQRQLLCLARIIIRKNKILVLDEATANVDPTTDALIQRTIRKKFQECTVLTIAHRLHTVMDSDKILVMDHGQVVEFGAPHLLLQNNDGHLTKLCYKVDPAVTNHLRKIAEEAFNEKFRKYNSQEK